MARKSKRLNFLTQEPPKEENIYNVAVYLRLSIEEKRDIKDSESMEYQKQIILDYIADKPDMKVYDIYCDNGKTGTNFERDGFQQMMYDVYNGKVNCIIVKDLSRFGREFIETGDYLERIFPMLGIRFIAINDHYDNKVSAFSIAVPIKNVINSMYARDLSKKSAAALRIKQQNGEFIGGPAPYGYLKSPKDKHKLIIDEDAAKVVRMIFEWKAEGVGNVAICRRLYDMNIPSPSKYKYDKGLVKSKRYDTAGLWLERTVAMIISSQMYIGNMVQGKTKSHFYNGGATEKVDRDNWVIVENTHEPIVSRELFDKVQSIVDQRRKDYYKSHKTNSVSKTNIFKGKVICGECNHAVKWLKNSKNYYFTCPTHLYNHSQCDFTSINEKVLKDIVFRTIKLQISMLTDLENALDNALKSPKTKEKMMNLTKQITETLANISYLKNGRIMLTSDFAKQKICEDEYMSEKDILENELRNETAKLEQYNKNRERFNKLFSSGKWIAELRKYGNVKRLTAEMLNAFVRKIKLFPHKRIEIEWNFAANYSEISEIIDGGIENVG